MAWKHFNISPCTTTAVALLICCLNCSPIQVSSFHTLKQAPDKLNSSSRLVSADGNFTLGFYTPPDTNNTYLAVWFGDPSYLKVVWIGNRDKPVLVNASPALIIGSQGEMTITHDIGEPIVLFGGWQRQLNTTATLMDSGNLVVTSNESSDFLWQSFDHPTDTLLPGMRIGVDHTSGRNWTLTSWFDRENPASGAFTLEWDPSVNNFLVRRRGEIYWKSGELKYYTDEEGNTRVELQNFIFVRDPYNLYFNFTKHEEGYLVFSLVPLPLSTSTITTGWRLDEHGDIYDVKRTPTIAIPSLCYNYFNQTSADFKGCESREQPECRDKDQEFVLKSGDFMPNKGEWRTDFDSNSSLSLSDCMEACWDNCECLAYMAASAATPGCLYYKGKNVEYVQSVTGLSNQIHRREEEIHYDHPCCSGISSTAHHGHNYFHTAKTSTEEKEGRTT